MIQAQEIELTKLVPNRGQIEAVPAHPPMAQKYICCVAGGIGIQARADGRTKIYNGML